MIFNPVIPNSGGGSDWHPLPAAPTTRAPSYGYFNFSIEFEKMPEGIVIKSSEYNDYTYYTAFLFPTSENTYEYSSSLIISIQSEEISENKFTGTIQYDTVVGAPFYYKEIR